MASSRDVGVFYIDSHDPMVVDRLATALGCSGRHAYAALVALATLDDVKKDPPYIFADGKQCKCAWCVD